MTIETDRESGANDEKLRHWVEIDQRAKALIDLRLLLVTPAIKDELCAIINPATFQSALVVYQKRHTVPPDLLVPTDDQLRPCRKIVRQAIDDIEPELAEYLRLNLVAVAVGVMLENESNIESIAGSDDDTFRARFNDFFASRFGTEEIKLMSLKRQLDALTLTVIQSLDFNSRSTEQLEFLLGLRADERQPIRIDQKQIHLVPDFLTVDSSILYQKFRESLYDGEWTIPDGKKFPFYDLSTENQKMRAIAEIKPDPAKLPATLEESELTKWQYRMWEHVSVMDDLAADISDITNFVWLQKARHPTDSVWVSADDISRFRGLQPQKSGTGRRGGFKTELRREYDKRFKAFDNTWITVYEMEVTEEVTGGKGEKHRQRTTTHKIESKAYLVTSKAKQETLWGETDVYAWYVSPGDVFAKYLMGPGRQVALLSQKALKYDPYRQKWEKRLTRYFAWQWRIRQREGSYLEPFAISTLLKSAKEQINVNNPAWTKSRLEKCMDALLDDGVIASWQYDPRDYHEDMVGKKGWWQQWLAWRILVEPPNDILDHYAKIKHPDRGKPRGLSPGGPAAAGLDISIRLRETRKARGLTLMQASEEIGIDVSYLAKIEKGKHAPKGKTRKKLDDWLSK